MSSAKTATYYSAHHNDRDYYYTTGTTTTAAAGHSLMIEAGFTRYHGLLLIQISIILDNYYIPGTILPTTAIIPACQKQRQQYRKAE